ncbi:hypothetical protein F5Y14DRAFT_465891 [Nemania sp. NC0429]|nr:hypothetical protein F5Y14DRAFT_465891 [Nemania sp. NC0429]
MPSSIPYDPSLVLGGVVDQHALANVENISKLQSPVDAAQDALNSLISSKRSLDMTRTELKNIGANVAELDTQLTKMEEELGKAAATYASAKMSAEPQIQKLREQIRTVHSSIESPVDYLKTEIKSMPLSADTMNMDVQYFSFDSNSQSANVFSEQIASYVSESTSSIFFPSQSTKIAGAASAQVLRQVTKHDVQGTLVLSVSCTHKNASLLAPFIIHVDKAISVWNHLFPDKKLDPTNKATMMKITQDQSQEDKEKFSIISGVTFGSSFVGMVHILNSTNTTVGDTLSAAASSLQATMDAGSWFNRLSGKSGVDEQFGTEVKSLLSQQNVTSHVTLLSMGVIPSMVANDVAKTVEKFADFSPQKTMEQVAAIQNATESAQSSVASMAESSRTGGQAADMQGKQIASSLSALAPIDDSKNRVLDVNSMMTALDDYLQKASKDGAGGVPINYFLKDIDQKMLAEMWVAKYYPGQYMAIKFDDSEGAGPATSQEQPKL